MSKTEYERFAEKTVTHKGKRVKGALLLAEEHAVLAATEALLAVMILKGVSRSALAEKVGHSKSAVSQLLNGRAGAQHNVSLRTLARYAHALGCQVDISLRRVR